MEVANRTLGKYLEEITIYPMELMKEFPKKRLEECQMEFINKLPKKLKETLAGINEEITRRIANRTRGKNSRRYL